MRKNLEMGQALAALQDFTLTRPARMDPLRREMQTTRLSEWFDADGPPSQRCSLPVRRNYKKHDVSLGGYRLASS